MILTSEGHGRMSPDFIKKCIDPITWEYIVPKLRLKLIDLDQDVLNKVHQRLTSPRTKRERSNLRKAQKNPAARSLL